ncbi:hypothetical protein CEK28_14270 [Xenophilus sp. AP218F]|nr:hypothetical protein CEK28_14270 [Xenophilus sp. AP218F]
MIKRWQAYFRGSLGRRMLLAGGGLIALALSSGAIAIVASYLLGQRSQEIVEDSVPAILQSTVLEQESNRLHRLALQLTRADSLTEIAGSQRQIEQPLGRMEAAAARLGHWYPQRAPQLTAEIGVSRRLAGELADLAQQRQSAAGKLRMARMRLEWLHADLTDELQQLTDEQSRLLQQGRRRDAATLRALLQLSALEQEWAQTMLSLTRPRPQALPAHALDKPRRHAALLLEKAAALPGDQSGNLSQLLRALPPLSAADGELAQTIDRYARDDQALRQRWQRLEGQLQQQNELAAGLASQGRDRADAQFRQALSFSRQGRWLVVLATLASVALTLWILLRLVGHRVIGRLALLGRNIEAIGRGQLPRHIGGRDEIGQLGLQLEQLAARMEEMERTNALALISHTAAALLIVGPDGKIRSINQAARQLCPELERDDTLTALLPPDTLAELGGLQAGTLLDRALPHGDPADERYLRLLARAFRQRGESVRMVTLLDVSAQMRSARWLEKMVQDKTEALDASNLALRHEIDERKRAQNSLVQATKFAVLGQTATSLAHELNQPLAALTNYLYLARLQDSDPEALRASLAQADKVLERMGRLVRSYRTLGRNAPPSPQLAPLELTGVLNDVIELLQGRIRQQQAILSLAPVPALPAVAGEVVRLEQILLNLLGNALDAAGRGGEVRLAAVENDGRVELYVADSGAGLPPDSAEALFQPFFTTKPDGLGLGLSICRQLAEDCRAEIRIASAVGGGALFILSLEPYHVV